MFMHRTFVIAVAALGLVWAQTPTGWNFTAPVIQSLNITYASNDSVDPPGERIPLSETAQPPSLNLTSSIFGSTATGLLTMVDLDVMVNGKRTAALHWLVPGVTSTNGVLNVPIPNSNSTPKVDGAPYIAPAPPNGDVPHRYVLLLFNQPLNFSFPTVFSAVDPPANVTARIGFNLTQFLAAAQINSAPIAANFFQAQNTSDAPLPTTTSGSDASASPATSKSATSTGAAYASSMAAGAAGAGILGLAALLL